MSKRKFENYCDVSCYTEREDMYYTGSETFNANKSRKIYDEVINGDLNVYTIGNEIHFTAPITKESIEEFIRQISVLVYSHQQKHKSGTVPELAIVYIVDSGGGSLTSTFKCIDFMDYLRKKYDYIKFTSICTGMVASAGTLLCAVADHCYITKNCHAMIHELSSSSGHSKYFQILSNAKYVKMLHNKLVEIYCKKTKKPVEDIERLLSKEKWFSAQKYLKHGFVDEIK